MEKNKFYNTGTTKGFTRAIYYDTMLKILNEEEVNPNLRALCIAATEYEIERLKNAPKRTPGPKKDILQSDFACQLRSVLMPLLSKTPHSADEFAAELKAQNIIPPSGKPYTNFWISRLLRNEPNVVMTQAIATKTNSKGLKYEAPVNMFALAN